MGNAKTIVLLLLLTLSGLPHVVRAQGIAWDDLSAEQQQLLAPLEDNWDGLPDARRQNILNGVRRWQSLTPEQQQQAQRRFQEWNRRPRDEREIIRERFQNFRSLDPQQQRAIRERFRDFQNLPEDRRRILRERFENRPLPPGGARRPPGRAFPDRGPPPGGAFPERGPAPNRPGSPQR
jgi:hypothetical protein